MAKKEKKPVHRVQMTEGKRAIIQQLLQEYEIETAEDIQDALKDLLGGTIKEMMEAEMDKHLGYGKSERIEREDISDIDQKIISMYAKGMTTRQISDTLMDIYGFEASEGFISDVTDKLLPRIEEWQNRPLDAVYPVVFIDAIHYSVRDNGIIKKLAAYVILGITAEGKKEVLTIEIGQNESAKYVAEKDRKPFAADLKKIYNAPNAERAETIRDEVAEKWNEKYPNAMKSRTINWDAITYKKINLFRLI